MQITKTPEQLAARRARVKQFFVEGRVETEANKNRKKKEQKYFQALEDRAELILAGLK